MKKIFSLLVCIPFFWGCSSDESGINEIDHNIFEISSAIGLKKLSTSGDNYRGVTIRLVNDITLSSEWPPIEEFAGTFDGQGYTINNLLIGGFQDGQAFIKQNEGIIRNLKINGNISGGNNVAGICAINKGTLENCNFSGTVTGKTHVGGVCGYNANKISGCLNFANVKGGGFTGGICGISFPLYIDYDSTLLTHNGNRGDISSDQYGHYVGGIAGYACAVTMKECENSGSITGNNYVGGIAGIVDNGQMKSMWSQSKIPSRIENCNNSGPIQAINEEGHCHGGICGYITSGAMKYCRNSASVSGGRSEAGGIAGQNYGMQIDNCRNGGKVSMPFGTIAYSVGGICGSSPYGSISNSVNEGKIIASGIRIGGICGENSSEIINCYNVSAVTSTNGEKVGGICGENNSSIIACYNNAPVTGGHMVGGIAGSSWNWIRSSYNLHSISGTEGKVGGICGYGNNLLLSACYNIGNINGPISSVGSLCGTLESSYHLVQDGILGCYYKEGTAPTGIVYEQPYSWEGIVSIFADPNQASQDEVEAMNNALNRFSWAEEYKYIHVPGGFPVHEK